MYKRSDRIMISHGQSKSVQRVQTMPPHGDSDQTLQYSDFDRVIQQDFGIIKDVAILFSQSSHQTILDDQESDPLLNAKSALTAPHKFQRLLPAAAKKKIRKAYDDFSKPAGTSKDMVIPKNRDIDINNQVRKLRKCYKNKSYVWDTEFQKRILHKKLVLREFVSICKEINPEK
jgi:hypothetical protein